MSSSPSLDLSFSWQGPYVHYFSGEKWQIEAVYVNQGGTKNEVSAIPNTKYPSTREQSLKLWVHYNKDSPKDATIDYVDSLKCNIGFAEKMQFSVHCFIPYHESMVSWLDKAPSLPKQAFKGRVVIQVVKSIKLESGKNYLVKVVNDAKKGISATLVEKVKEVGSVKIQEDA